MKKPSFLQPFRATLVNDDRYTSIDRAPDQLSGQPIYKSELPHNLYIPKGAESVNLKNSLSIGAVSTATILEFTVPQGHRGFFFSYAFSAPAGTAQGALILRPQLQNKPIMKFHGNPSNNFQIDAETGNDLTDNSLVSSQIYVPPLKVLKFDVRNTTGAPIVAGFRLVGYIDATAIRRDERTIG